MLIQEKIGALIDGSNIYGVCKHMGIEVDYRLLLKWLRARGQVKRAYYFTAVKEGDDFAGIKPLIDYLDYNGYTVVTKPVSEYTDAEGNPRIKGNMDIDLCVYGLRLAERVDHIYLFSGDGDFLPMVEDMQERSGVSVTVVSHMGHRKFNNKRMSYVADRLRRAADEYIDLVDLVQSITSKEPRYVPTS